VNDWKISELASIAAMILMGIGLSYFVFWRPATANDRAVQAAQVQTQADLEAKLANLVQILSQVPPEALGRAAGSVNASEATSGGGSGGGSVA
jgi:hypothetical protein